MRVMPHNLNYKKHSYRMEQALSCAREAPGRVWPNPAVGCVIVKDGEVIARARTEDGGRPHAEEIAFGIAGEKAKGASVYVTLEPCNHEREGGSCTERLIRAGVKEVYVACEDPDPRTAGQGIQRLKEAGIQVYVGLLRESAEELNRGFFLRVKEGRPLITLKVATSADEKIAGGPGRWITGEEARAHGHQMRAEHDAILVGIGTVLADDPLLTTRVQSLEHQGPRVVLDTHLRIDKGSNLVQSAFDAPLWVVCETDKNDRKQELEALGCIVVFVPDMSVSTVAHTLAKLGLTRVLVEGGAQIYKRFLDSGLVDKVLWYQNPQEIGEQGITAFPDGKRIEEHLSDFVQQDFVILGEDDLRIYSKASE